MHNDADAWAALAQRASRASHDLIGWTYWHQPAIDQYAALGIDKGLGYYAATRFAPLADAGNDVVASAGFSIHAGFLGMAMDLMREHTSPEAAMLARDATIVDGLTALAPDVAAGLGAFADDVWGVVDGLHAGGRPMFAAHRAREYRGDDPTLSAWLAINCLREWRGDVHWALCVAFGLDDAEVGLLHTAMVEGYESEWIARSRGADDEMIERGWARLEAKGFATNGQLTEVGVAFRRELEDRTDTVSVEMWQALGRERTVALCELVEPAHEQILGRIDETAGPKWMPAARHEH